jgi:hypothetical protein
MRQGWVEVLEAMGVGCVIDRVGAWAMPVKGDVGVVDEGWRSMRVTAENRGHSARSIQQGCVGISLKSFEWR